MSAEIIKQQIKAIPKSSGVYQFFGAKDEILYIGKAKNLQKRLVSYTKPVGLSVRIERMVFLAKKLEVIQTTSEVDALLLEHNLIKKLEPKFNILLRDDKTFPQILISDHFFPRIAKHRTSKVGKPPKGFLFGPFASAHDVNRTIDILRKAFLIRNCTDAEFKSRRKPCLEYQIKRCSAPCVSLISQDDYQNSISDALSFLKGQSTEVQKKLITKMQILSGGQEYEKAAEIRDQIKSLNSIQEKQNINVDEEKDFDAITIVAASGMVCIYISFFRGGQNYGARPYFYEIEKEKSLEEFLSEFLGQFYLEQIPPSLILLNLELSEKVLMQSFLEKLSGKKTEILIPKKAAKSALIKDQTQIAIQNLEQKISQKLNTKEILLELKNIFNLEKIPQRIEVYDNSHISGTNAVGALITAGPDGFIKSGYRKFNIRFEFSKNRDDTSMINEVLTRRFSKLEKRNYPDLIIIDGGKPQLSAAQKVFSELKVKIDFVCMSKGENRNAGEENFHQTGKESFTLPKHNPVMHYLQRLRDEAHRFAIMTHRKKRSLNFAPK